MLNKRTCCPVCDATDSQQLINVPYADSGVFEYMCAYYCHAKPHLIRDRVASGSLIIVQCKRCSLIYQREIPDDDFMTELYGEWIIEGDALAPDSTPLPVEHYAYLATEVMHLLAEQRAVIGNGRHIRVLDFGMGWGAWLQMARSLGAQVYGAEISDAKVRFAHSIGIPVLPLEEIATMKFDLICTEQVLEHVPNPAPLVQTLVAALAPTGYIKFSVPPGQRMTHMLPRWTWENASQRREEIMPVQPLEHINCFTRRSLDFLAARYGLERAPISAWRGIVHSTGWHSAKSAVKNILRPIYRFAFNRGTYAIYRNRTSTGPSSQS